MVHTSVGRTQRHRRGTGRLRISRFDAPPTRTGRGRPGPLPGRNIYAADGAGMLSPAVRGVPYRIYVPNTDSRTVDVIDPTTFKVVDHYKVGKLPQHVVPGVGPQDPVRHQRLLEQA